MVNAYTYEPFSLDDVINFALHAADSVNKRRPASGQASQQQQQQQASPTASTTSAANPHHQTVKRTWQPDIDLYESAESVIVEVALPGVDKSNISLEFDQKANRLLITGEAKRRDLTPSTNNTTGATATAPASPTRKATVAEEAEDGTERAVVHQPAATATAASTNGTLKAVRHERPAGAFERVVGFNQQAVRADDISASFENGILVLTVPKDVAKEQKRKIAIA